MIYSCVEEHRGTFQERMNVVRLLTGEAAESPDIPRAAKWFIFKTTVSYFLPWKRVGTYIVSHADEDAAPDL